MKKKLYYKNKIKNKIIINNNNNFNLSKSIAILKHTTKSKFIETTEAHINLNFKKFNQRLSKTIIFPHNINKKNKIIVLTTDKHIIKAKEAGADIIKNEDSINELLYNPINFDILIATPEIIPKLTKFGKILGPKGLMPSVKSGTLVSHSELVSTIKEFKKGKFEYKNDSTGNIHIGFGKINFSNNQLIENLKFLYESIKKNKPKGIKGIYFNSIYICTTMSPSIKLNINEFN